MNLIIDVMSLLEMLLNHYNGVLNKLRIYYSSNDNSIMIALTSFGDNYEGENKLCQ